MIRALALSLTVLLLPTLAHARPILTPSEKAAAINAWKNRPRHVSKAAAHLFVRLKLKRHTGRFFGWKVRLGQLTVSGNRSFEAWPSKYGRLPSPGEKISSGVYGYVKMTKGVKGVSGAQRRVRIEHSYTPLRGLQDLHAELARDGNPYSYIGPQAR